MSFEEQVTYFMENLVEDSGLDDYLKVFWKIAQEEKTKEILDKIEELRIMIQLPTETKQGIDFGTYQTYVQEYREKLFKKVMEIEEMLRSDKK